MEPNKPLEERGLVPPGKIARRQLRDIQMETALPWRELPPEIVWRWGSKRVPEKVIGESRNGAAVSPARIGSSPSSQSLDRADWVGFGNDLQQGAATALRTYIYTAAPPRSLQGPSMETDPSIYLRDLARRPALSLPSWPAWPSNVQQSIR
jgi:hypothetical protein